MNIREREYDAAWRNIAFWDEHTWGADKSVEEPDLPIVKQEWEFKRKFAVDAANYGDDFADAGTQWSNAAKCDAANNAFDVYNTSSWPRTDVGAAAIRKKYAATA